jgi:hypothetical protein
MRPTTDDLIFFVPSKERDPEGSKLRRLLHAHIACGEVHEVRQWLLRAVILMTVPVWILARWPSSLPDRVRSVALASWVVGSAAVAVALILELWCRHLRSRYLQDLGVSTVKGDA